ncbi:MAG TPA: hypothetical protein VL989_03365 [Candidatus Sulfotelmatobacter sp.]|nr:hypothetical protein [Candidatus Sulfotelmatobacter sp.]
MPRKTKRYKKPRKGAWFIQVRGSYLPASSEGWLLYIPFIAYLVFSLVIGINNTNRFSTAVLFIVPNWVAAGVVMTFLASKKS